MRSMALLLLYLASAGILSASGSTPVETAKAAIVVSRADLMRHYFGGTKNDNNGTGEEDDPSGIQLASFQWENTGTYVTVTLFLVLTGLAKVVFHYADFISSRIPESCLLLLVGLAWGGIIKAIETFSEGRSEFEFPMFTPTLFFYFLLPPIALESAYSLYDRAFFDNISTILWLVAMGTLINFFGIGFGLFGIYAAGGMGAISCPMRDPDVATLGQGLDLATLGQGLDQDLAGILAAAADNGTDVYYCPPGEEYNMSLTEVLTYASFIISVDPVAVLAIFQSVGVNADLYFLVFGESLLNDAVAVVLYNTMITFASMAAEDVAISGGQIVLGILSFFTVAFGGFFVGIIIGLLSALVTKTTSEVRVVEPLAMMGMAYLAYITADLFRWSGILSIIGCGLVQSHYAFKNISKKSSITVNYFIKMLSAIATGIIFLYLGIELIDGPHQWDTGFVLWAIFIIIISRFVAVYVLVFIANQRRIKKITLQEQFIMSYGGLRGAVCFALVEMIVQDTIPIKPMFLTTTLASIIFTMFIQGSTIKPLVSLMNIAKKKDDEHLISEEINDIVMENMMASIEIISGKRGSLYFGRILEHYDEHYMMKWFCTQTRASNLTKLYEELAISDHLCHLYGPALVLDPDVQTKNVLDDEDDADQMSASDSSSMGGDLGRRYSKDESFKLPTSKHSNGMNGLNGGLKRHLSISMPTTDAKLAMAVRKLSQMQSFNAILGVEDGGDRGEINSGATATSNRKVSSVRKMSSATNRKMSSAVEDRDALANAFKNNPFNKIHQKYNPNLIGDDNEQELEMHLRKRHVMARKLSTMAAASTLAVPMPGAEDDHYVQGTLVPPIKTRNVSVCSIVSTSGLDSHQKLLQSVPLKSRSGVGAILQIHEERVRKASAAPFGHSFVPAVPMDRQQHHHMRERLARTNAGFEEEDEDEDEVQSTRLSPPNGKVRSTRLSPSIYVEDNEE